MYQQKGFFVHIRKQIKVRKYNVQIAAVFGGWHLMNLFVIKSCKKIVDIVAYLSNKMAINENTMLCT